MTVIIRWVILAVAVALTTALVPGIDAEWRFGTYLLIAAVFATANVLVAPLLRIASTPASALLLGVVALVVNAALLLGADWLLSSFEVDSFFAAMVGSFTISICSVLVAALAVKAPGVRRRLS